MLCERVLRFAVLTVSTHAHLASGTACLPPESLAGFDYLQVVEAAHIQAQL